VLAGLRNFFISLFVTLVVFGIAAYFLMGFIKDNLSGFIDPQPTQNTTQSTQEPTKDAPDGDDLENTDIFTALILGIDDGKSQYRDYENPENEKENERKKEADTIFLVNVNAITKVLMISPLPCDMKVEADGYRMRLGSAYSYGEYTQNGRGMELMKDIAWSYTGLEVDYCVVLDYDSIEIIIDSLGGMEYAIPEDMYHKPVPYDVTTTNPPTEEGEEPTTLPPTEEEEEETTNRDIIDIKKKDQTTDEEGKAILDGAEAVALLRYKNYKDEDYSRDMIQLDFVQEFIKQKMTLENLLVIDEIYEEIQEGIADSDINEETVKKYMETLFSVSEFALKLVVYPGSVRTENGTAFFDPIIPSAIERYKEYRRAGQITAEDQEEQEQQETAEAAAD